MGETTRAALAGQARYRRVTLATVQQRVCATVGVDPASLSGGSRARALSRAREGIAYLWTAVLGRPGRPLAAPLGVRPQSIYTAAARGRAARARWDRLVRKLL